MQIRIPRRAWTVCYPAATLLVGVVLLSAPLAGQVGPAIEGQVSAIDGNPLPTDISVRLEAAEGTYMNQTMLGTDGRFAFTNLNKGMYRVVVTAKGYQTATQSVDMAWSASRIVRIYLVPAVKKTSVSPDSQSVTATDHTASKLARKEFEKGLRDLDNGNLEGARKHLEKAVAEHACYARAHTMLGMTLGLQRVYGAAESAFAKSIECDAAFGEAYIQLAVVLNAQNKYRECDTAIQQGLRRFPNEWQLYYHLGIAKDGAGDYAGAEQALLRAQAINPEVPPEFHLRIADVYLNSKKYEKAYEEMSIYVRADPQGRYAGPTRRIMRQLETSGMVSQLQKTKPPK